MTRYRALERSTRMYRVCGLYREAGGGGLSTFIKKVLCHEQPGYRDPPVDLTCWHPPLANRPVFVLVVGVLGL
jgi:hypothetical protein